MPLSAGTRLGPYEILSALGAGGMGEVYRARDTKLGRDVALKILPDSFTHDPERLARFRREAQMLASLNHPHIGAIYGLDEANGTQFLVLELVDGETLADRIKRGPIAVDDALSIAKQIAEALEAAHEKGIIHRDLKPANIALTADGHVKVLDFGLAKAIEPSVSGDLTNSPTLTSPAMMTGVGMILGTAAYMSPEQAKGRQADKRSDVWAFGCVLFEMFAGKRAFEGEDVSDTLATVLKGVPDWAALPPTTSASMRTLLRRCLEKDRTRRLGDMSAARLDVEDALAVPEPASAAVETRRAIPPWRWALPAILCAAIVGGFIGWTLARGVRESRAITRFSTDVAPADRLAPVPRPFLTAIALSPDGRTLVFSGARGTTTQLFTRPLDQSSAAPLAGTDGAVAPLFSPDGLWIAFVARNKLRKVPTAGGPSIDICDIPVEPNRNLSGASWGSNGTIAFSTGSRIMTVSASGGTPKEFVKTEQSSRAALVTPHWLPGERVLLYTSRPSDDWTHARIVTQSIDGGAPRTLVEGAADPRYVSTGHLLYLKLGTLVAVPFDPVRAQVTGPPVALLDDVMQAANMGNFGSNIGAGQFVVAPAGTLAYVTGGILPDRKAQLVWVDRRGTETPLKQPPGPIGMPRISPDGQRVAYATARGGGSTEQDVWVYDLTRDVPTRLTFGGSAAWPTWAPDGRHIVFFGSDDKNGSDLYWMAPDGTGSPERVTTVPNPNALIPSSASLTGLLALVQGSRSVSVLPLAGDRIPKPFVQGPFRAAWPAFTSDGRWLAYGSDESGRIEVYVQAYPGPGDKHRISRDGGTAPVWARSGRELFFVAPTGSGDTAMMAVDVSTASGFRAGEPRVLFSRLIGGTTPARSYDVTADGQRFIMSKAVQEPVSPAPSVHIVLNWTEDLKARVPTK